MGRRLQSIYEYFSEYSVVEINNMLEKLSDDEKKIILERYGSDLNHPVTSSEWSIEKNRYFYNSLVPKMRRLLEEARNTKSTSVTVTTKREEADNMVLAPYLLDYINQGKTNQEICQLLHLESQQLYELLLQLKNRGFIFSKKLYSDGSIKYKPHTFMAGLKNPGINRTIITEPEENDFKALVLSDLHYGNKLEDKAAIESAFEYCVKNDIHIILCGGDFIDGTFSKAPKKVADIYKQLEYFIKNYPKDDSILTIGVGGDHDLSVYQTAGFDLISLCDNYRPDVIIGGYNNTFVNIKNDLIHLYHHIDTGMRHQSCANIVIHGHSHQYATSIFGNQLHVVAPSASNINTPFPSCLELNCHFEGGRITFSDIKHIQLGKNPAVLSSNQVQFFPEEEDSVRNEEIFRKQEEPVATEKEETEGTAYVKSRPSQIDKFYKRYGTPNK